MRMSRDSVILLSRRLAALACMTVIAVIVMKYWSHIGQEGEPLEKSDKSINEALAPTKERDGVVMNANTAGLILNINIPSEVSAGDTLLAEITLENQTDSEVAVHLGHSLMSLKMEITTSDGSIAHVTERGAEVFPSGVFVSTSGPNTRIAQSGSHTWRANLNELFELPPGKYRMVASVRVTTTQGAEVTYANVKSNATDFTVK